MKLSMLLIYVTPQARIKGFSFMSWGGSSAQQINCKSMHVWRCAGTRMLSRNYTSIHCTNWPLLFALPFVPQASSLLLVLILILTFQRILGLDKWLDQLLMWVKFDHLCNGALECLRCCTNLYFLTVGYPSVFKLAHKPQSILAPSVMFVASISAVHTDAISQF